jgi:hypothetical protein
LGLIPISSLPVGVVGQVTQPLILLVGERLFILDLGPQFNQTLEFLIRSSIINLSVDEGDEVRLRNEHGCPFIVVVDYN